MSVAISLRQSFWAIAIPMIITNISLALLGLVDTAVLGMLDHAYYLGGVAVGSMVFDLIYWAVSFIRTGTVGIAAQVFGKRDQTAGNRVLWHALLVALVFAFILLILSDPIIEFGVLLLDGSDEVRSYAKQYCYWVVWGAPAVLSLFAFYGWFLGNQNAKAVLLISIFVNVANIVLDFIFVLVFEMDVRGVALASVISQYLGVMLAVWLAFRTGLVSLPNRSLLNLPELKRFIVVNHNLFIRTVLLLLVFFFFTRQGARQGDEVLAANAILIKLYLFMSLGLDGLAHATEVLAGEAVGSGERQRFRRVLSMAFSWSFGFAVLYTLFYCFAGGWILGVLTDLGAVRALALEYFLWMEFCPLIAFWCFVLDGVFIGTTRSKEMRNSMLFCVLVIFFPLWYVLLPLGNHGLWLAFTIFLAARGITLGWMAVRIERRGGFVAHEGLR